MSTLDRVLNQIKSVQHDQLSEEIIEDINQEVRSDFGAVHAQATINADRLVCEARGYNYDPVKERCAFTEASCQRDSDANQVAARAQCEVERADLKRRCREGDGEACDEYDDRFKQKSGLWKTVDVGCPDWDDSGYYEWLGGKCVKAAAAWRDFCEGKGLTYAPDPKGSGMGFCFTNEKYCDRKGVEWRKLDDEHQGDCHIGPLQWLAELILGTTITRSLTLGLTYLEKGLAAITNERLGRGLTNLFANPLISPLSPWAPFTIGAALLYDAEGTIVALETMAEDLVYGGAQFVSDVAVGAYNFLDDLGLIPPQIKIVGEAIGEVTGYISDTFGPAYRGLKDAGMWGYNVARDITVAVLGTFSDILHGDFSFSRIGDLFNATFDLVGGAIADAAVAVGNYVASLVTVEGWINTGKAILTGLTVVGEALWSAVAWLGNAIYELGVLLVNLVLLVGELLWATLNFLWDAIKWLGDAIVWLGNAIADLARSIARVAKAIVSFLSNLFSGW